MDKENREFLNDSILIKSSKDSYMSKENLVKMIENLNFTEVKSFRLECITGYQIMINDKGNKYVQTLGFEVEII